MKASAEDKRFIAALLLFGFAPILFSTAFVIGPVVGAGETFQAVSWSLGVASLIIGGILLIAFWRKRRPAREEDPSRK